MRGVGLGRRCLRARPTAQPCRIGEPRPDPGARRARDRGRRRPGAGVAAGIVTAIVFDFFLTVPYGARTIDRSDDVQTTVLLAAVGLVGGELVERARRSHAHVRDRDREIERFQRRAELAAAGEPPGRLIAASPRSWPTSSTPSTSSTEWGRRRVRCQCSRTTERVCRVAPARLAPTSPRYQFGLMAATSATSFSSSRGATPGCRSTSIAGMRPLRSRTSSASRSSATGDREALTAVSAASAACGGRRATGTRGSASRRGSCGGR